MVRNLIPNSCTLCSNRSFLILLSHPAGCIPPPLATDSITLSSAKAAGTRRKCVGGNGGNAQDTAVMEAARDPSCESGKDGNSRKSIQGKSLVTCSGITQPRSRECAYRSLYL
jgi:hypothetical protein